MAQVAKKASRGFSIGGLLKEPQKPNTREIRVPEDCRTIHDALRKSEELKGVCHILLSDGTYETDINITTPVVIKGQHHTVIKGNVKILTRREDPCILYLLHITGTLHTYNKVTYLKDVSVAGGTYISQTELTCEDSYFNNLLDLSSSQGSFSKCVFLLDKMGFLNSVSTISHSLVRLTGCLLRDNSDVSFLFTTLTEVRGDVLFDVDKQSELTLINVIVTGDMIERPIKKGDGKTTRSNVVSCCGAKTFEGGENVNLQPV